MTSHPTPDRDRPRLLRLGPVRPIVLLAIAVVAATLLTAGAIVASIP